MKHQHPCATCHRKTACFVPDCALSTLECHPCAVEEMIGRRAEHEARVHLGLESARSTLAEIWRRHSAAGNESMKLLAWDALSAVIEAEATMRAADRLSRAETRKDRESAQRELAASCVTRAVSSKIMKDYREAIERDRKLGGAA